MKEIMIPYVLLIWLLVKTGAMPWNLKTQFWSTAVGLFLAFMLFTGSRFWAPVDMTNSTTVRAPQAVLSPLLMQEVEKVHVVHNQKVKKGDLIYTLVDTATGSDIDAIKHKISSTAELVSATEAGIRATQASLSNNRVELGRLQRLGSYASQQSRDQLGAKIKAEEAKIEADKAQISKLMSDVKEQQAKLASAEYKHSLKEIRAPFDGKISTVNLADGTRTGNMHIYDTSKKFVEMRIPDQAYPGIQPGQLAEFYVDAYPGTIFRGRVQSLRTGTGEAAVGVRQGDQHVRQFVGQNASAHGRTVIIEFQEPEGYEVPIGATGAGWISAKKPYELIGFIDIIGAATVRLTSLKSYFIAF